MEPITLVDAARQVLLTIAPLIAAGTLARIGEEITDTARDGLARAWDAVEARFKRRLTDPEKVELLRTTRVVEAHMAGRPKAAGALAYFRADPEDKAAQQIVEAQLVEVFKPVPDELIDLARAIAALQPAPPPAVGTRNAAVSGNARVGVILQGDVAGNLTLGPIDLSDHKRIASPGVASTPRRSAGAPGPAPSRDPRSTPLPVTLSADGVHFTYGHALIIGVADYADDRLQVAGGTTANDARALGALLRDPHLAGYPPAQVRELIDAKATRPL